jgi:hypothetical protein
VKGGNGYVGGAENESVSGVTQILIKLTSKFFSLRNQKRDQRIKGPTNDEHRSSCLRPVKFCLYQYIFLFLLYPKGEGGILFYLCLSFCSSKIFFVAFFSVTVDGRNLIFGHKHHIGKPYCG